jgi:hypothetical protein
MVGLRRQRLLVVTRLFLYRDSVGYITATRLRPKSAAVNSTRSWSSTALSVRHTSGLPRSRREPDSTLMASGRASRVHSCRLLGRKSRPFIKTSYTCKINELVMSSFGDVR